MDPTGKVIIVTGASHGIGEATARQLAALGASVVLAARSAPALAALERELPNSLAVPTDVQCDEDVGALIKAALGRYGRIDALIHGAGRGMYSEVEAIDINEYRELFELNVCGFLRVMQAVVPPMREQGSGAIVVVSSKLTRSFYPRLAGYTSTKYALNSLALSARQELTDSGIVVSLIRPKLVLTDFGRNAARPEPEALRDGSNPNAPPVDTAEFVAGKIVELLRSGDAEMDL